MTIEELFGTLQQAVTASWRKHLRTAKYAKHEALDEFYKEMPEKVDNLIEAWMGANGKKVKGYTNLLTSSNMNTLKYLTELKKICKDGYDLMDDNEELESLLDDIVNLINSTLYKVKELSESTVIDLVDYINEVLNESKKVIFSSDNDLDYDYDLGIPTEDDINNGGFEVQFRGNSKNGRGEVYIWRDGWRGAWPMCFDPKTSYAALRYKYKNKECVFSWADNEPYEMHGGECLVLPGEGYEEPLK